ncbi:HIT family protein [Xenophilus arseniciresistens]|uniref:HIT family protein n=1 Tax=Xenophilus arseniciresistens TaxID=1283306 RepID=A0AAE3N6A3_9BURK|nr:HIT family protein [Xenophilus arseniciresistens]MDA7416700.1 HIT family protein [Xenophilus arseniciresistens]
MTCPLCDTLGGRLVYQGRAFRVIHADEAGFPAFYRVVWQSHVAEFSELAPAERVRCMEAVMAVELALRNTLAPRKINLAALGNMVAHLHWHVIARFEQDSHFPSPVWAAAQRARDAALEARVAAALPAAEAAMIEALQMLENPS